MKTVSLVQARMGSTRFPGKTLADLVGTPLLTRVLERIADASGIDEIVVATTAETDDDALVSSVESAGFRVFRGSTQDVLDRFVQAARQTRADVVIRNTADEPFVDPRLIEECLQAFRSHGNADYVSNNLRRIYPEGLDTEIVSIEALEIAHREARLASDREHVTPFLWRQPERFRLVAAGADAIHPEWRLTVDYPEDLAFARACFAELPSSFGLADIVSLLEARPDLLAMCPAVPRREGYLKSVSEE